MNNTQQDLCISLLLFLLHAKQNVIALGAEFDLTSMQAMTLLMTDNSTPRSMNSFCKLYDCDASNVTGIIDGLEQKGLVSRQNHPDDRRIKVVRLEAAGVTLRKKLIEKLNHSCNGMLEGLSDDEATQFVHMVHKLARNTTISTCPITRAL